MEKAVRQYILNNYLFTDDEYKLGNDDSLLDRGLIDSTGILELVTFIEERFGVQLEDEEMVPDNLDSVNKIVRFIESKREAEAPGSMDMIAATE